MGKFKEKESRLEVIEDKEKLLRYGHRASVWSNENCWKQTVVVVIHTVNITVNVRTSNCTF